MSHPTTRNATAPRITSPNHIASHNIMSCRVTLRSITFLRLNTLHLLSRPFESTNIAAPHFNSPHLGLFRVVYRPITSHLIKYPFYVSVSLHFISHPLISHVLASKNLFSTTPRNILSPRLMPTPNPSYFAIVKRPLS
jgi:hypothetical protein